MRGLVRRLPGGSWTAAAVAAAMSPAFRGVVGLLIAFPRTRATGGRALVAAVAAAMAARVMRDALGRPRPGPRDEGGFPSRHAAAAAAIAATVARELPQLGTGLGVACTAGSLARVAHGDHEPADIAAGAVLGVAVAAVVSAAATVTRDRHGG